MSLEQQVDNGGDMVSENLASDIELIDVRYGEILLATALGVSAGAAAKARWLFVGRGSGRAPRLRARLARKGGRKEHR